MSDKHAVVQEIKRLASLLGHAPSRTDYREHSQISERQLKNAFGSHTIALHAAGFASSMPVRRAGSGEQDAFTKGKTPKFKYVPTKPSSVPTTHTLDLEEMFKRAGDPVSLKLIFQPDTHWKHRDEKAVSCFLSFCTGYQAHVHLIGGDFLDAGGLSHWDADTLDPKRIVPEVVSAREGLQEIQDATPTVSTRIFLKGNHEDWVDQFLRSGNNPQLHDGLEQLGLDINVQKLLNLDHFGYQFFEMNHLVRIGRAAFTHGLYTGDAHAKKHLMKLKCSVYYGHLHDTQSYNDTSIDGPLESASLGCLCDLNPTFLKNRPNNWKHAFGVFEFFRDGSYSFMRPNIENGRLSFGGQVFQGL